MKAIVFHGPNDLRYESTKDPSLEADSDVILRVTRTAICGTDLHLLHGGFPVTDRGFAVGHEFVGTIEEVGRARVKIAPKTNNKPPKAIILKLSKPKSIFI